jgi:SET domain-containing protein
MSHLHPFLTIKETKDKGRGVFALNDIEADTLLEVSPVIVLNKKDTALIHQTALHDYYFIWGDDQVQSAVALGYISIYNHSPEANCYHTCNFKENTISIYTKEPISANDELKINYNMGGEQKLWFTIKA